MPIERTDIIDALLFDEKSDTVTLLMTEPRPWDGTDEQVFHLQEKLNAYLSFALDGEMAEAYPQFAGKRLRVQLDCLTMPDDRTVGFLAMAREQIAFQNIDLEVRVTDRFVESAGVSCGSGCGCACSHDHADDEHQSA